MKLRCKTLGMVLTVLCLAGAAPQAVAGDGVGAVAAAAPAETIAPAETADSLNQKPELTVNERRKRRGLTNMRTLFVPKGQWVLGCTASYSTHTNDNYKVMIIDDITSEGYTVKASPILAYALRDNMALGARFTYSRMLLKLDSAHLKFGDDDSGTELSAKDFYTLTHSYTGSVIWRTYIPLGQSRRFAFFNEMSLSVGGSQAKFANDSPVKGTYQRGLSVGLGVSPGIVAFATNNMAFEINVGVMGINYRRIKQVHNQVHDGDIRSSNMNFKVNIFSIGLGVAFYL